MYGPGLSSRRLSRSKQCSLQRLGRATNSDSPSRAEVQAEGPGSSPDAHGICPRATEEVFRLIQRDSVRSTFLVTFSMVELYCQRFIDLLAVGLGSSDATERSLRIRTTQTGEVYLENLCEQEVSNPEEVDQLMRRGLRE